VFSILDYYELVQRPRDGRRDKVLKFMVRHNIIFEDLRDCGNAVCVNLWTQEDSCDTYILSCNVATRLITD
jgi:hypothetical protein